MRQKAITLLLALAFCFSLAPGALALDSYDPALRDAISVQVTYPQNLYQGPPLVREKDFGLSSAFSSEWEGSMTYSSYYAIEYGSEIIFTNLGSNAMYGKDVSLIYIRACHPLSYFSPDFRAQHPNLVENPYWRIYIQDVEKPLYRNGSFADMMSFPQAEASGGFQKLPDGASIRLDLQKAFPGFSHLNTDDMMFQIVFVFQKPGSDEQTYVDYIFRYDVATVAGTLRPNGTDWYREIVDRAWARVYPGKDSSILDRLGLAYDFFLTITQ